MRMVSQQSLNNNGNIKMAEVFRKNLNDNLAEVSMQFCLPSTNPQRISNGKFNDHIRDTYPQMMQTRGRISRASPCGKGSAKIMIVGDTLLWIVFKYA